MPHQKALQVGRAVDRCKPQVASGRGVTVMPESLHLGHGTRVRPLIEPTLSNEVSLVTVAGHPYATAVQHLIRAARIHKWVPEHPTEDRPEHELHPS